MEKKEIKRVLEKNLDTINSLWRSLWHWFQKQRNNRITKRNRTRKFLEQSW